jgi:hypothetical protein
MLDKILFQIGMRMNRPLTRFPRVQSPPERPGTALIRGQAVSNRASLGICAAERVASPILMQRLRSRLARLGVSPHVGAVVEIVEAVTTAKPLKRDGPDAPDSG